MRTTKQLSITIPNTMAEEVTRRVERGEYASESEVIRDGLRALFARDEAVEKWLTTEVAAAYDDLRANPENVMTSSEVRAHLARVKVSPPHGKAT